MHPMIYPRPILACTLMIVAGAAPCAAEARADASTDSREMIPDGSFERGNLTSWEAREGSRLELVDGALRVLPGATQAKIQLHLGQGHRGKVLVWRGRLRAPGAGKPAQLWLYTSTPDYENYNWLVQTEIAPGRDWQDFALVIPVPTENAHHAIIGALRDGGVIEIDDWSATIREP